MPVSKHGELLRSRGFVAFGERDKESFSYALVQELVKQFPKGEPFFFHSEKDEHTYARDEHSQWWVAVNKVDLSKDGFVSVDDLWRKHPRYR